jgi:hypothetical protein
MVVDCQERHLVSSSLLVALGRSLDSSQRTNHGIEVEDTYRVLGLVDLVTNGILASGGSG